MNALIIFLKKPILGNVKTRIANESSDEFALAVYHHIAQISIDAVSAFEKIFIFSDQEVTHEDFNFPTNCQFFLQQNFQDLGENMTHCINKVRSMGYENVGIMGVDCPEISLDIIKQGFHQLSNHEISIGPSEDGGFYFITCTSNVELVPLFKNVTWSTSLVCDQIQQNAKNLKYQIFFCATLYDIDYRSDYQRFLAKRELK